MFGIPQLALGLAVIVALGGGAAWLRHQIRVGAQAEVHAEYAAAARAKNAQIREFSGADDMLAAVADAERTKALEAARAVPGTCPATAEQALALSRIK